MSETVREPIDLPALTATEFKVMGADVEISAGGLDLVYPQLILEGTEKAFKHSFVQGRLRVTEVGNVIDSSQSVTLNGGRSRVHISGSHISGSSVIVNGVNIFAGQGTQEPPRKASLILPPEHPAAHQIETQSGDVKLELLNASRLNVATMSGDIALSSAHVETVWLKTMSGDIEIEDLESESQPTLNTMSGDVEITGSEALGWTVSTMSGNVKTRGVKGEVQASSMSGRIKQN